MKRIRRMISMLLVLVLCLGAVCPLASAAVVMKGSSGSTVRQVQYNLNFLGFNVGSVDGVCGNNTVKGIRNYQKSRGLEVDGMAGPATQNKLLSEVRSIQTLLSNKGFYYDSIDGIAGPNSIAAAKKFQQAAGLSQNGVMNDSSLNALKKWVNKDNGSSGKAPTTGIYVSQGYGTKCCTGASAAMLLRAKRAVRNKGYSDITLQKLKDRGIYGAGGLSLEFTYDGMHMEAFSLRGTAAEKKAKVENLLAKHPEGIVLYGWGTFGGYYKEHAVYMAPSGKILDPYPSCGAAYLNLSQSASSASSQWSSINQYWIITN